MGELGRSPRERPDSKPEDARKAVGATGEAVAEEMAGKTGSDPDLTAEVVEAGGAPFAVVEMAGWGFLEGAGAAVVEGVEQGILREARSRAGGDGKSRCPFDAGFVRFMCCIDSLFVLSLNAFEPSQH